MHDLSRTEHVAGRCEADLDIAESQGLAVARRLQLSAGILAVTRAHDRERPLGREHARIPRPGMVAVAMRDHRPGRGSRGIDEEVAGFDVEPLRGRPNPALGTHAWAPGKQDGA
jgi:hypothetical protein